jgi:hypothetical protein
MNKRRAGDEICAIECVDSRDRNDEMPSPAKRCLDLCERCLLFETQQQSHLNELTNKHLTRGDPLLLDTRQCSSNNSSRRRSSVRMPTHVYMYICID